MYALRNNLLMHKWWIFIRMENCFAAAYDGYGLLFVRGKLAPSFPVLLLYYV